MQQPPQNDLWNTWGNNQQPFPQPDWSDPNQPTYMAPAFPGQFQSQIPPPPPPPKKRNRRCLIGGIMGGVLAALLLLCIVVASFAPPAPQTSGKNTGVLVTPTPTPTTAITPTQVPNCDTDSNANTSTNINTCAYAHTAAGFCGSNANPCSNYCANHST